MGKYLEAVSDKPKAQAPKQMQRVTWQKATMVIDLTNHRFLGYEEFPSMMEEMRTEIVHGKETGLCMI